MTGRTTAAGALATAAIAVALALATSWRTGAERPMTGELIATFRVEGFDPEHTLRQTFVAPRDGLSGVRVGVAAGAPASALDASLLREDGSLVTAQHLRVQARSTTQDLWLAFAPEDRSRGRFYALDLRQPPEVAPVALEGVGQDGLRDGQFIDPLQDVYATRQMDLNVRLYHQRTFGQQVADIVSADRKTGAVALALLLGAALGLGALASATGRVSLLVGSAGGVTLVAGLGVVVLRVVLGFG